jgi:ketosteroid isomerase-like protein
MTTMDIAQQYVELCKQGKFEECLRKLYAKDAVSVEALSPPSGEDRVASGLDAIVAKGKTWGENNTVHKADVSGPYPNEDRFAVRFTFDVTNKPSGKRMTMDEIGLFSVKNGKITREEFFYSGA